MLPVELEDTQTLAATPGYQSQVPALAAPTPQQLADAGPSAKQPFSRAATCSCEPSSAVAAPGRQSTPALAVTPPHNPAPASTARGKKEQNKLGPEPRYLQLATADNSRARRDIENMRWPEGPICPRCRGNNVIRLGGAAAARGLLHCRPCRRKFTVTAGTPLHGSHLPIRTWAKAMNLVARAGRRYPAARLRRDLDAGITYETAQRMRKSIRKKKNSESNRSRTMKPDTNS